MRENEPLVAVVGRHAVGKSTVCGALEQAGFDTYPEIGKELRKEVDFEYMDSVEWFDLEVMKQEQARDAMLRDSFHRKPIAIETWHIGNIAFAAERSPQVASLYKERLREEIEKIEPVAIIVDVENAVFEERATDPIANEAERKQRLAFYDNIRRNIQDIISEFEIPRIEVSGQQDIHQTLDEIQSWLNR